MRVRTELWNYIKSISSSNDELTLNLKSIILGVFFMMK
jgi:hypothetical protein